MRRQATLAAFAALAVASAMFGCSLLAGLDHLASYAYGNDAGLDAAVDADARVVEAGGLEAGDGALACTDDAACTGHCGVLKSRCGAIVACGGCPAGQTCGAALPDAGGPGTPNVCAAGAPCTPTCEGKTCGDTDSCDGVCAVDVPCPGSIEAGTTGLACVGGVCKCEPGSCSGCCSAGDGLCHSGAGGPGGCGTGGVICQSTSALLCSITCGGNGQPCCAGAADAGCMSPLVCEDGGYCGCAPRCAPSTPCGHDDGCGGICQGAANACGPGQRCVNGGVCVCDPTSCGGCCNGNVCEGADSGLCGIGGVACAHCEAGTCNAGCGNCGGASRPCCPDGTCVAPLACDRSTDLCTPCVGSCAGKACGEGDGCGHVCNPEAPDAALGEVPCGPGLSCAVDPSSGVAMCACSAASCPEGCCIGGVCINGNAGNPELCGIAGMQCHACSMGQVCSGGRCQDAAAGDP